MDRFYGAFIDECGVGSIRLKSLEDVVRDPQGFWLRSVDPHVSHDEAVANPIVCAVNLKDGVEKTTICANLAACFAGLGKRHRNASPSTGPIPPRP